MKTNIFNVTGILSSTETPTPKGVGFLGTN